MIQPPDSKCWEVEIRIDGEPILTIGEGYLSGREDIHRYAERVRACAEHLMGFIGNEP